MYKKIVQSGDMIEIYEYEKEPSPNRNFILSAAKRRATRKKEYHKYRTKRSIMRAALSLTKIVRSTLFKYKSQTPYFVTLTMVDVTTLSNAYKAHTKFTQRLRKHVSPSIQWISVPEFQKRGAVHFHMLIWGLPYEVYQRERDTRDIQAFWGYGFIDILPTDGSPKISTYMGKYMSKALYDDRLRGEKSYSSSRGLMRPVSLNTAFSVATFEEEWGLSGGQVDKSILTLEKEKHYDTQWLGRAKYYKYVVI